MEKYFVKSVGTLFKDVLCLIRMKKVGKYVLVA